MKQIEMGFKKALNNLSDFLNLMIQDMDSPYTITNVLSNMFKSKEFTRYTQEASMKMVTNLNKQSYRTWRQAARKGSRGREIYEALRTEMNSPVGQHVYEQVERNAEIIKTLPLDLSKKITKYIQEETIKGRRASAIAEDIKKMFPDKAKANANLIARTEVSKTQTALTRARSQNVGVNWYVWRTSEDARVRSSHRVMEGVLVRWKIPPAPELLDGKPSEGHYHAGEIYNCRCSPRPLISLDEVQWPCKVYTNGTLRKLTKKQFEEIM